MSAQKKNAIMTRPSAKPMHIVHVGNHTIPCHGGVEYVIWESARAMAKHGHRVEIIVFNACANQREVGVMPAMEEKEGVRIHRLPLYKKGFYLHPRSRELLPLLGQADIVHVHGLGGWLDTIARHRSRIPGKVIITSHGGIFHTRNRALLKRLYLKVWLPIASRKVDGIIYVSPSDADQLRPYFKCDSIVIPNGITLAKTRSNKKKESKKPTFLFVGRLSTNKQVDLLIRTFARLHEEKVPFNLQIVGDDWEGLRAGLELLASEQGVSGSIQFFGAVEMERLRHMYAHADYFVSASAYEGFGISALESMAAGCIPILNRIPSFEGFIGEKSQRGLIVDYRDPVIAAQAIRTFLEQRKSIREAMRKAAHGYAEAFSWDSIVRQQLDFYARVQSAPLTHQRIEGSSA